MDEQEVQTEVEEAMQEGHAYVAVVVVEEGAHWCTHWVGSPWVEEDLREDLP